LVPQWAKMADRMRGAHQRGQAATRSRSLPLQRLRRNEPLGWPWHHRRQRRQHRPCDRKAIKPVGSPSPLKLYRPPVTPAGIALRLSIDRRSPKRNFAPGSSLGRVLISAQIAAPLFMGHLHRLSKKLHSLPSSIRRIIQPRGHSCAHPRPSRRLGCA
jgi:hypothetical protein